MKRRQFIIGCATASIVASAGCTEEIGSDIVGTPTQSNNPWGKGQLIVGLEQRVNARHDIHEIIEEALGYWAENDNTFAGYDVSFRYRPNSDEPDIQIVLVGGIQRCGEHSGEYAGCATVESPPRRAEILIIDGYRREWMITTLKHELGHALGLDHDDEPAHVMSNRIEDRIPDYHERKEAIQKYADAFEPYNTASDSWSEGVGYWEEERYERAETALRRAFRHWSDSRVLVDFAINIVGEINEERALNLLDEPYKNVDYHVKAADAAVDMAIAAQRENWDAAETYREDSNTHLDRGNQYEFDNYEQFVIALGFPRP